jgi:hypothetical protein
MKKDARCKPCVLKNLNHPREDFFELTFTHFEVFELLKKGAGASPLFLN